MSLRQVQELFPGPIDIVGDIHGEIDALRDLLRHLGYDQAGVHPQGRRLMFIGDLTDRGPDSPAVIELVSGLVSQGSAQCVLGNHELNLLRKARKEGNGWYFDANHDRQKNKFLN
jgi:predicted MPP superfamily phosphohydrolase